MSCILPGNRRVSHRWLFAALLMLANFFGPDRSWAQSSSIPLGTAASFGLLSGGALTVSASAPGVHVLGVVGATSGFSGALAADSGAYWPGGAPSSVTTTALADLAEARAICTALPAQQPLENLTTQTLTAGTYALSGNVTMATDARLQLTGDSTSRFVFNISGGLTINPGAMVVLDGIRPGQVFWNVTGALTAAGPTSLAGIVLGGGSVTLNGVWAGYGAVLTSGNINLTTLSLDGELAPAYFYIPSQLAWRSPTNHIPAPPPPCTSLVVNGNCEVIVPVLGNNVPTRLGNVGSRANNIASEVAFWQNPNEESPDYFRPGGIAILGVPGNTMNNFAANPGAPARSGAAYLGVYSQPAVVGVVARREYVWQTLANSLVAGRRYYAEFYALRAPDMHRSMQALGLAIRPATVTDPYERIGPVGANLTPSILGNGAIPVAASVHDAAFNSTTVWSRTAGVYLAQGGERHLIVGNFATDANAGFVVENTTANRPGAYYYLDDINLFAFPLPTATATFCPTSFTLGLDCLLPASSGATYAWSGPGLNATGPTVAVTPTVATTYTLTTTVFNPTGGGQTVDVRTITVTPPTVLNGTLTGGQSFPVGNYVIPDNGSVVFTNGTYTFAPGSVVRTSLKEITVGSGATLIAQATTFAPACDGVMWNGIKVTSTAGGLCLGRAGDNLTSALPATAGYGQQNPVSEIRHAVTAITWDAPTTVPVRLLHTRILHCLTGLNTLTGATSAAVHAQSAFMNNQFDSQSNQFQTPETDNYTHVALNLGGWNYQNIAIAGNRFQRCMVGILLRNRTTSSVVTIAGQNEFVALMVGIHASDAGAALTVNGNRFSYGYPYPTASPISAALMSRFATRWPGVNTSVAGRITGVYMPGSQGNVTGQLTVQDNEFRQGMVPNSFPTTWAFPQRGAIINVLSGPYVVLNNTFEGVETALSVGLRFAGNATSKMASNRFINNSRNLVFVNSGGSPLTATPVFWPQCNTFRRTVNSGAASNAIRVETGATVVFDNWEKRTTPVLPNFPTGQQWVEVMKNRFDDQTGTNQRMRYLSNGGTTTIRYTAYSAQDPMVLYSINLRTELASTTRQSSFNVTLPGTLTAAVYNQDQSCQVADGLDDGFNLPRPVAPVDSASVPPPITTTIAALGVLSPNPATADVTLAVQLPDAPTRAELLVRDMLTGRTVLRLPISANAKHITFSVAALRNGVYTCSVVTDNAVLGTRRLLVNHEGR